MTVIEATAETLHMKPEDLIKESLKVFIEQKIVTVEAEIFLIAKKFGVKDIFELDQKIEEGLVGENEAFDDYFHLDHLEAERKKLKQLANQL
jgi:low affinity Fe/Cu permease